MHRLTNCQSAAVDITKKLYGETEVICPTAKRECVYCSRPSLKHTQLGIKAK
jgi:hypothetical protein